MTDSLHKLISYIPDTNLTPAQRRQLSDWLDGKEGAKFPVMKNPDLRAVVNAVRQYLMTDGYRAVAQELEQRWRRAEDIATRAFGTAHERFCRIMELQTERAELRKERDEAIRRAETAESILKSRGRWPDWDDPMVTSYHRGAGDGSVTATEAKFGPSSVSHPDYQEAQRKKNETLRRAVDTLANLAPKETLLCVGGPLDGQWHTDAESALSFRHGTELYHQAAVEMRYGRYATMVYLWKHKSLDQWGVVERVSYNLGNVKESRMGIEREEEQPTDRTPARPGMAS